MKDSDFELFVGLQLLSAATYTPTEDEIIEVGNKYDPYLFHTYSRTRHR